MADMVVFTKAVETGTVDFKQAQGLIQQRQFVEIDEKVKDPVEKLMLFWQDTPMKNRAFIEGRVHAGKSFFSAAAASNPDLQASS